MIDAISNGQRQVATFEGYQLADRSKTTVALYGDTHVSREENRTHRERYREEFSMLENI